MFRIILLLFLGSQAFAGNLQLAIPEVELTPPHMQKTYDLNLGFQDEKYFSSADQLNGYNNFAELKLRAKAQALWSHFRLSIDVGGTYATNISNFGTGYAPEAYASYFHDHVEVSVGRRFFNWSQLDSYWQLGLWQPDFRWNYLQPVEQGLTGLFVDLHNDEWKLLGFFSPIFIPEQTAPFNLQNGQINSQSPWFSPPAKYVQLFSGKADIQYNLMTPSTSSIIDQTSFGGALQWNPKPVSVKFSYVYKPRNSLSLPVNGYLALQPDGSNAPVFIYPKVVFHHLAGFDFNYRTKDFSAWFSALGEFLANQNVDPTLTTQILSNQMLYSPGFEWLPLSSMYSPRISVSGLFQSGGEVSEVGSLASPGTNIFSYPIDYRNASQVRIAQPIIRSPEQALDFNLKWIEEYHDLGSLVMAEFNYQYQLLNLFGGVNLLGSGADASNSGFTARYRDNSLAYAGAFVHF